MYAYLYSNKCGHIQKSLEGNPPSLHREACDGGKDEGQQNTGAGSCMTYTITCIFFLAKSRREGDWAKPSRFFKENAQPQGETN